MSKTLSRLEAPKTVAIIQARLGSTRFPRKVLRVFDSRSLISIMLERVQKAQSVDEIVLAIPETPENDELHDHLTQLGFSVFRGSEDDVLARYWGAATMHGAQVVIRLTADCPLIDPTIIDGTARIVKDGGERFAATSEAFPDGLDVEVFRFELLDEAFREASDKNDREHVTPFIRRRHQDALVLVNPTRTLRQVRLTVDEDVDLEVITRVLEAQGDSIYSAYDIDDFAKASPEAFRANQHLSRNEGAQMSSGQKLWRRAEKVVAGGNMLVSKHPKMHLPDAWPIYFSSAKDCRVWDMDGRELLDMGWMGVGTNILGYAHPKVDEAVKRVVDSGNMSSLNGPEEVELAERILALHSWADSARFTRTGGEAGAVAVRLARAATGQDRVVFCGYHGWHDWYLAANLADDKNLDGHLLPGLEPSGVPRSLRGTATPFSYNDLAGFRQAIRGGEVAAIVMEVERSTPPDPGFIEEIRRTATEIGAVLIFDECTSGFRQVLGGHHLTLGIEPDIAIFGKALGNGYAINAVIGRESVMSAIDRTFISSTFWTERIGSAAAIAALKEMEASRAPEEVHKLGQSLRAGLKDVASSQGFELTTSGLPALTRVEVEGVDTAWLRKFISEKLLYRNILGGTAFYVALPHSEHISRFLDIMHEVLGELRVSMSLGQAASPEPGNSEPFTRLN